MLYLTAHCHCIFPFSRVLIQRLRLYRKAFPEIKSDCPLIFLIHAQRQGVIGLLRIRQKLPAPFIAHLFCRNRVSRYFFNPSRYSFVNVRYCCRSSQPCFVHLYHIQNRACVKSFPNLTKQKPAHHKRLPAYLPVKLNPIFEWNGLKPVCYSPEALSCSSGHVSVAVIFPLPSACFSSSSVIFTTRPSRVKFQVLGA